jgi:predicted SAM-dependent methyltransferase
MKLRTRIALAILPAPVWEFIVPELHLTRLRWKNSLTPWRFQRFRRMSGANLHLGCGKRVFAGWINIDGFETEGVDLRWDLRKPLPFRDGAAAMIYSEHVLEHLEVHDAEALLRECHRLLRPGGRLRIGVPDTAIYMRAYCEERQDFFNSVRHLGGTTRPLETPMAVINQSFRMGGAHRFAWDFESLRISLENSGFVEVRQYDSGQASCPEICKDDPERAFETLYVEGVKPGS